MARPATVTWTIRNAANEVVVTHLADAALPGRRPELGLGRPERRRRPPAARHLRVVRERVRRDVVHQPVVKVEMNAFAIATSTASARAAAILTVTVTSAESLSGRPPVRDPAGRHDLGHHDDQARQPTWRANVTLKTAARGRDR